MVGCDPTPDLTWVWLRVQAHRRVKGHVAHIRRRSAMQEFLPKPSIRRRPSPVHAAPLRPLDTSICITSGRSRPLWSTAEAAQRRQRPRGRAHTGWCAAEDACVSCDVFQRKFGQLQWDSPPPHSVRISSVACDRSPSLVHVPMQQEQAFT